MMWPARRRLKMLRAHFNASRGGQIKTWKTDSILLKSFLCWDVAMKESTIEKKHSSGDTDKQASERPTDLKKYTRN
jgi:hypothetical protein